MGAKAQARLELTARDKTTAELTKLNSKLGVLIGTANAAKTAFASLGVTLAPVAILGVANNAIRAGSAITDMASATRTGVEELQVLTYAARIAGASNEQMANALIRVQKSASDAKRGLSTATDAFAKLGINVNDFINLSPEQMLEMLSRKLVESGKDTRAYGAALDLLGTRNAPKLLEVLERLGTQGFAALESKARGARQVMAEDVAVSMDYTADAIDTLFTSVTNTTAAILKLFELPGKLLGNLLYEQKEDAIFIEMAYAKVGTMQEAGIVSSARYLRLIKKTAKEIKDNIEEETALLAKRNSELFPPTPENKPDPLKIEYDFTAIDNFVRSASATVAASRAIREITKTAEEAGNAFAGPIDGFENVIELSDHFAKESVPKFSDSVQNQMTEMEKMGRSIGLAIEDSLARALVEGELNVKSFVSMFLAEFAKLAIIRPMLNAILGGSPIGNFLGFAGAATGGMAGGGNVMPGNVFRVGEQGPENIVMGGPGYVQTAKESSGNTVYLDARGADAGAVARIENALRQLNASIEVRAISAVSSQFSRNPSFGVR